jgi:hypothetical protein
MAGGNGSRGSFSNGAGSQAVGGNGGGSDFVPTPQSAVRRRAILLEQQALVFRLEQELGAAQRDLKALNKASYEAADATVNI